MLGLVAKSLAVAGGFIIIILLALVLNTGFQITQESGGMKVTASFFPLYDWARNVIGDKGTVINLTPSGMDPHDLDPTPQDISNIISSKVFLYNGAGMEGWVERVLSIIDKTHTVAVDVSIGVAILHSQSNLPDPHFWVDPSSAIIGVENIELGIEQADPANTQYYRQNAQNYIDQLKMLHKEFLTNLASVRIRTFICFHEAFNYWKSSYNLTGVGIYGFEPEGEPSATHIQDLLTLAQRYRITFVLASNLDDPHWCQVLADQIKGKVSILDPVEGSTSEQAKFGNYTYLGVLYNNINVLKETLA